MDCKNQRKIFICLSNDCWLCGQGVEDVPEYCSCRILHVLYTKGGYQERRRGSGKTAELVEMANALVEAGQYVYYIVETKQNADYTRMVHRPNPLVQLLTVGNMDGRFRGMAPGVVLADDITVLQMEKLRKDVPWHTFMAHYWTPRP